MISLHTIYDPNSVFNVCVFKPGFVVFLFNFSMNI